MPFKRAFAHGEGKECLDCHQLHNNEEYRLLTKEAINGGKIPCYRCHGLASKSEAPRVEEEFTMSHSRHPIGSDEDCLKCHELDRKHNDGRLDRWPDIKLKDPDPLDSHVYTGAKMNDFCLSCHDNSPVTLGSPPRTPIDLSSAYEFSGHGRIDINEPCNACHEHHASLAKPYLIKDVINETPITGNDNSVCFACHSHSSDAYPGKAGYLSSEHGMRELLCIDCHNPHGDNKDLCYLCHNDKYSAHYSAKRNKLCIDCHNPHQKGGLKMTKEEEEKLCYLCHRELERAFGNTRDGVTGSYSHHKVDDEEMAGGEVECADCHNPHTVTQFNIVNEPAGNGILMPPQPFPKDAYGLQTTVHDNFCLSCHDGSRRTARNIRSELQSEMNLESGFTDDGMRNLHKLHADSLFGCPNCHDAHATEGTGGIKRGALLHEELTVKSWEAQKGYYEGQNSCASASALGCHR